ncbi:MAG: putative sulfate exporter family transporter [Gammaproteobacteria bacterium]|nr:putative sulfate exporter family transporter [Gammaproteobacteria bacterium]
MAAINRKWSDGMLATEDWQAVWLGLILFFAGMTSIWGVDLVGWMAKTKTWELTNLIDDFAWSKLLEPGGKREMHPLASFLMTYAVFSVLVCTGAYFQKQNVSRFFLGWTCIFLITWACWIIGHEAHFKAVDAIVKGENIYQKYELSWGLQLGVGFSYMLALAAGLIIGNFFKKFANFLQEAAKPEWFIKTAIVCLGIKLGVMSMKTTGYTLELALAAAAATFVAYLLFWPLVYVLGRKVFKLRRDTSAVLSSGISICGVAAAIATAGAIRAKPVLPVAVSMLVVIFAMIELAVLPGFYAGAAPDQPIVNGAAMGMTVKTDGANIAAGAILDEMMGSRHLEKTQEHWEEDWILSAAILTKIWIDVFIGVWAFILAIIWLYNAERKSGETGIQLSEIWFRFPKFVIGYFIVWFSYMVIAVWFPELINAAKTGASIVENPMRKMMFMLTFVSIGIITDFSKLKGIGRLALLYAIALFSIIAPTAYAVAYIFHNGMTPPLIPS